MTKAIILSAGQGQRLKPLTNECPKGMVKVAGRTIIERQLELFRKHGIQDVVIVKGFCAESVPDYGVKHSLNSEYAVTNMVFSLFCAADEFGDGPLVVSYGDILYSGDVLDALEASDAPVSVVVDLNWKEYFAKRFDNPYDDAESLTMKPDRSIVSIGQSRPDPKDIEAQYIGLIKFEKAGLAAIRAIRDDVSGNEKQIGWGRPWRKAFMTDMLQELVRRGHQVRAVPINGGWCEVDSLRDFALAEKIVPQFSS
jgi:L-glutamine-phosphate cytidylyltransferase